MKAGERITTPDGQCGWPAYPCKDTAEYLPPCKNPCEARDAYLASFTPAS